MSRSRARTPPPPDPLPDVLQFMRLLWAVAHGLARTSRRMTRTLGVTGPQRLVLRVVGLLPGASPGDLASIMHVHPSTLTGVLKRLIDQGLLVRGDDPRDRRRAILRLTARGRRANVAEKGTVEAAIGRALAQVSARDRAATRRVLGQLAGDLTEGGDLPAQPARAARAGQPPDRRTRPHR